MCVSRFCLSLNILFQEPEVDINCSEKNSAESFLISSLENELDKLNSEQKVILKLPLPEKNDFFLNLTTHSNIVRIVALSGGYSRTEANRRLMANERLVASFSRALTEGLLVTQTDKEFTKHLNKSIESIYESSI